MKDRFPLSLGIILAFGVIGVYTVFNHFIPQIGTYVIIPCVLYIYVCYHYYEEKN
jgi:hypothetical protein